MFLGFFLTKNLKCEDFLLFNKLSILGFGQKKDVQRQKLSQEFLFYLFFMDKNY